MDIYTVALALLTACLCLWAYRQGLRDGMGKGEGKPPERVLSAMARQLEKEPEDPPELTRMKGLLAKVEAYDGTGKGGR